MFCVVSCECTEGGSGGGGLVFSVPQVFPGTNEYYCANPSRVLFREWNYLVDIVIRASLLDSNLVACQMCSGGALSLYSSGYVHLFDTVVSNSNSGLYGGGLYLGGIGSGSTSCALEMVNVWIGSNNAGHAGDQIYSNCAGELKWSNLTVDMQARDLQIVMPLTGNVTAGPNTTFMCPPASRFVDTYGGLYGHGSYMAYLLPYPWDVCPFYVSSLQFGCNPCEFGSYSMESGMSNGQPQNSNHVACNLCPFGGSCDNAGSVAAAPGYWGGGFPTVSFTVCRQGYCCDDSASSPCMNASSCHYTRTGQMCGDCVANYTESLGSVACVPSSNCSGDRPLFLSIAVIGSFISAAVLLFTSGVCWPSPKRAKSGTFKVLAYFMQMVALVEEQGAESRASAWLTYVLSFLRLQLPNTAKGTGLCVFTSLNAVEKIKLEAAAPTAVAAAMLCCVVVITAIRRCRDSQASPYVSPARESSESGISLLRSPSGFSSSAGYGSVSYAYRQRAVVDLDGSGDDVDNDVVLDAADTVAKQQQQFDGVTGFTYRGSIIAAIVNLLLLAYSVVLSSVVKLLHCVRVPGTPLGSSYLFIQGSVACDYSRWQLGYVFAMIALGAVPIVVLLVAACATNRLACALGGLLGRCRALRRDTRLGVQRSVVLTYDPTLFWWEAVLMVHRLALSLVYTLASVYPVIQTTSAAVLCIASLTVHLLCRPFRDAPTQALQTLLLLCLTVVALAAIFSSAQLQLAVRLNSGPQTALENLSLVFSYVIPLCGFALVGVYRSFFALRGSRACSRCVLYPRSP